MLKLYRWIYTCAAVNPLPEATCAKNVTIADITGTAGVREILRLCKYAVLWSQRSSFLRTAAKYILFLHTYIHILIKKIFLIKKNIYMKKLECKSVNYSHQEVSD